MRTLLWVVLVLDQLFILLIAGVKLDQFELSDFAFREQLAEIPSGSAKIYRRLHKLLPEVRLLQQIELLIAGVVSVALFSHLNKPVLGAVYSLVILCLVRMLINLQITQKVSLWLFELSLELVLNTTESLRPIWRIVGVSKRHELAQPTSLAEFTDQLRRLPSTVLNPLRRQRLESVLESEDKIVKDIMTPKKRLVMVEPSATLGPIVLSDLEKSGHGYFPVVTKKGEPEGILKLSDISDLQTAKQRSQVREQMSSHLSWVEESTSLYELAAAILQEKQYLVLVRNENAEFSGIVTIADLMKHLVGIVKE